MKGGGLNVGSFMAKNLSLLGKWWWRFRTERASLWKRVIASIHGHEGGLLPAKQLRSGGPWRDIVVNFSFNFSKVLGDGSTIRFWTDSWCGVQPLSTKFKRLFALETKKDCLITTCLSWQHPLRGRACDELSSL